MGPGQYWSFAAPRYAGEFKTKLRFKLALRDADPVYSDEFDGAVNKDQFGDAKQGHAPSDVMDPYDE